MHYCSRIAFKPSLELESLCTAASVMNVKERCVKESLHVFQCSDTNPVFCEVRFAQSNVRFTQRALNKMASECHWQN